jgi:hypothetical protein
MRRWWRRRWQVEYGMVGWSLQPWHVFGPFRWWVLAWLFGQIDLRMRRKEHCAFLIMRMRVRPFDCGSFEDERG